MTDFRTTRLLRMQASRMRPRENYIADLLEWAATRIDWLEGRLHDPHGWQPMVTYTARQESVLIQDGDEIFRARRVGGVWRCEDGNVVHPTHWMPFEKETR